MSEATVYSAIPDYNRAYLVLRMYGLSETTKTTEEVDNKAVLVGYIMFMFVRRKYRNERILFGKSILVSVGERVVISLGSMVTIATIMDLTKKYATCRQTILNKKYVFGI